MAKEHPAALADRLFTTFLAPLVLGGPMTLGRPVGHKRAFCMGPELRPIDMHAWSQVGLTRVRIARQFAPVDALPEVTPLEWALTAALHDLTQATHPTLAQSFSGKRAKQLLGLTERTLTLVPTCRHAGEALERHTLFARLFEIARTTTKVSWWTGSATFIGEDPPKRLLAWPGVRNVQVFKDPVPLGRLLADSKLTEPAEPCLRLFLQRTPLTDWLTMSRQWPRFDFDVHNLGLASTIAGRKLVLRALRTLPQDELDVVIGRAFRPLVEQRHPFLRLALDVFGEHVLEENLHAIYDPRERKRPLSVSGQEDAALAQAAGAIAAREYLAMHGDAFSQDERAALLRRLLPHTKSQAASMLERAWPALAA